MKKTFYLTSPLYYVNAKPHIGSAYTTIACDTLARFYRYLLKEKDQEVIFLTGVDEHGGKIEEAAKKKQISPQEHCDQVSQEFKYLWEKLEIKYDFFSRTSTKNHAKVVRAFFLLLQQKNDIYQDSYQGLYCLACEDFKQKRELIDQKNCPIHKIPVQEYSEENYFFKLSRYTSEILELVEKSDFVQPAYRKQEVLSWIKEGLKDFPISRKSVSWGIKVPNDPSQTIYVWFDALLGYLSPIIARLFEQEFGEPLEQIAELKPEELKKLIQKIELLEILPANFHIIGKDILRFHAVYWTGMLLSAGFKLPEKVFGHGFLTKDGEKMGKTLGNILVPEELIEKFGIDAVRFYFLFTINFGQDGDFSEKSFLEISNSFLANKLGNLFSRVIKLVEKHFNSQVPFVKLESKKSVILEETSKLPDLLEAHMKKVELSLALEKIFALIELLNLNLTQSKPWELLKSESLQEKTKALICLRETLESLRVISCLLHPFLPKLSRKMLSVFSLKEPSNWKSLKLFDFMEKNPSVKNPGLIFNRFESSILSKN